jgi:HK97 family phage major capsid protein
MPRAFEIRQKKTKAVESARALTAKAEGEKRELTPEENEQFNGFLNEADRLEAEARGLERLEGLEAEVGRHGDRAGDPLPHNDAHATRNGRHGYSVLKALRQSLTAREGRGKLDGLEAETHAELVKRMGRDPRGVLIPFDIPADCRAAQSDREVRTGVLNTTTGVGSIPTILAPTIIDILRTRMVVRAAGATVMSDMQGLFAIPRQSGAGSFNWVAEGAAPTATNQTIDQVPFAPKTAAAYTDYTRRFLEQTNQDAENFARTDLMKVIARGVDAGALTGTGSSNQPLGLLSNSNVPVVALDTNGAAPTYASLVSLETQIAASNADVGEMRYVTNAQGRSTLKQTLKVSGSTFPVYLWEANLPPGPDGMPRGVVNGYETLVSNQLPHNLTKGSGSNLSPIIFGNWSDLVIAFWSGIDVIVDPYTGSSTGSIRIAVFQDCDVNVRHPESFSAIVDMVTS